MLLANVRQRRRNNAWLVERICDAMREVGVLLLAFAPLDVALKDRADHDWRLLAFFLGVGILMFAIGLLAESVWRNHNVR